MSMGHNDKIDWRFNSDYPKIYLTLEYFDGHKLSSFLDQFKVDDAQEDKELYERMFFYCHG